MTTHTHTQTPLERLRHHVSGAIARGEAAPVVEIAEPATHTPGPWEMGRHATPESCPQFGVYAENGNGRDLAHVVSAGTTRHAETEANARLIAAAPEMLQALKNAREWLDELAGLVQSGTFDAAEDWAGANAVSVDSTLAEAIAKAEGGQQ